MSLFRFVQHTCSRVWKRTLIHTDGFLFPIQQQQQQRLIPSLQGLGESNRNGWEEEDEREDSLSSSSSSSWLPDMTTILFAVPKRKVSKSRRRMRTNNPANKMKLDESIYQCPKCRAYKKRHVLLHCPLEAFDCGLGEDKHVIFGKENRPTHVISAPSQGQTWKYMDWEDVIGTGEEQNVVDDTKLSKGNEKDETSIHDQ